MARRMQCRRGELPRGGGEDTGGVRRGSTGTHRRRQCQANLARRRPGSESGKSGRDDSTRRPRVASRVLSTERTDTGLIVIDTGNIVYSQRPAWGGVSPVVGWGGVGPVSRCMGSLLSHFSSEMVSQLRWSGVATMPRQRVGDALDTSCRAAVSRHRCAASSGSHSASSKSLRWRLPRMLAPIAGCSPSAIRAHHCPPPTIPVYLRVVRSPGATHLKIEQDDGEKYQHEQQQQHARHPGEQPNS